MNLEVIVGETDFKLGLSSVLENKIEYISQEIINVIKENIK